MSFKTYVLIIQFVLVPLHCLCDELNDYLKLVENEIYKANNYEVPTKNYEFFPNERTEEIQDFGTFDFIVVGAGSAGAIVAKRLAERKYKTLLIEAGGDESDFTDIPGFQEFTLFSKYNWGYYTKPQENICQGMINNQCSYPRGKSLGGSGTINNLMYVRGNTLDQEFWKDFGITGWSWDEVLPYYKKLENYQNLQGDPDYHGYSGPVSLEYSINPHPLINIFLEANREIYNVTTDYNGEFYMGAGKLHFTKRNGKRLSTNGCYLNDINEYLTIITHSFVYKIQLENRRAIGVEFVKDNNIYKASSKFEVILSCGVINSPQILMLSGIGPKEHLEDNDIPVVLDLPVGQHFEDHVLFMGLYLEAKLINLASNKSMEDDLKEYLSGFGRLTNTADVALSFISTENNDTYPDVEVIFCAEGPLYEPQRSEFNYKSETLRSFSTFVEAKYVFSILILLLHPKSRGTVSLQSRNPKDFPIIDSNSFFNSEDIETIYKSLKFIDKLLETKIFKKHNIQLLKHILPRCKDFPYLSKEFWICQIKHVSIPCLHGIATCRMGENGNSVVDSKLKVHGIQGLRVIDASVIPRSNSGNINAVVMMLAEKGADIIARNYDKYNV